MREKRNARKNFGGKSKGKKKDHYEDIDGRIILSRVGR
jgi:hypothetical protein